MGKVDQGYCSDRKLYDAFPHRYRDRLVDKTKHASYQLLCLECGLDNDMKMFIYTSNDIGTGS